MWRWLRCCSPHLPGELSALQHLALDLRWTWSHEGDALWEYIDADLWDRTGSPWAVLQGSSSERMEALARDPMSFSACCDDFADRPPAIYGAAGLVCRPRIGAARSAASPISRMEFGLGEALPLYAGGLGVLAGDFLKTASDLDLPLVGVGLLYQEGYFRQMISADGMQLEAFPYNEPATMPIEPVAHAERRLAAHSGRIARPHGAAARLAGQRRAAEALSSRFQRSAQHSRRSRHHGQALWRRQRNPLHAGDHARASAAGAWSRRCIRRSRSATSMRAMRPSPCWSAPAGSPRATVSASGRAVGGARGQCLHHPYADAGRASIASIRNWSRATCRWPSPCSAEDGVDRCTISWRSAAPMRTDAQEPFNMAFLAARGSARDFRRQPPAWHASAAAFSSRCSRAGRSAKCRSVMSPMACTFRPGTRRKPTASGPEACGKERWRQMPDELHRQDRLRLRRGIVDPARKGTARASCGMRAAIWSRSCASAASDRAHRSAGASRARPQCADPGLCAALHGL